MHIAVTHSTDLGLIAQESLASALASIDRTTQRVRDEIRQRVLDEALEVERTHERRAVLVVVPDSLVLFWADELGVPHEYATNLQSKFIGTMHAGVQVICCQKSDAPTIKAWLYDWNTGRFPRATPEFVILPDVNPIEVADAEHRRQRHGEVLDRWPVIGDA